MGVGETDYYYWGYHGKQLLVKNWMKTDYYYWGYHGKTAACEELDKNAWMT
jgi:hypothetical protein